MDDINELINLMLSGQELTTMNRALRLRIAFPDGISDRVVLPQRVSGEESICGGLHYTILCVSASVDLPLKSFIGLAAELQFVTDTGDLHGVCGLITEAASGQSDGGLATYQLVLRDMFSSVMALGANTRVFLDKNEVDIAAIVLKGWLERSPLLAAAFDFKLSIELTQTRFPARAFTRQDNESDAAFLTRLFKRRGIAWYVRPGRAMPAEEDDDGRGAPVHTLVLFTEQLRLRRSAVGIVRYHRADATEKRDSVTAWRATRALGRGRVSRFSWDYGDPLAPNFMTAGASSRQDQGQRGNRVALDIDDYRIDPPHVGDTGADRLDLAAARMAAHDYAVKSFHGEGTVRDLRVAEWITLKGHAEIDRHNDDGADQFIVTSFQLAARNNLPKALNGRIDRLFTRNRWERAQHDGAVSDSVDRPFVIHFTCSRRSIRIALPYDPRVDVPPARMHSAIVVGPVGETVHCDDLGRIKIRFPGTRDADHAHAGGAGASDTDTDSAWVRLAGPWAGNGPGSFNQFGAVFLPRAGSEVLIAYLDDDPDRPVVVGQLYNQGGMPAALSRRDALPGTRYLAGLRSREVRGTRGNQLRLDDTPAQISAQLASDHGASELNLGWLSTPRVRGGGKPRGEGAELRSDESIALRAAKGLLLSTWKRMAGADGVTSKQLARDEFAELLRDCGALFTSLGKYAQDHNALGLDGKAQEALAAAFEQWENGSNTAPGGVDGGAPAIGITAPAGIGFATSQAIVSYAATNIDKVAQQHLQLTAGQRFNVNAGKGLSLFAQQEGLTAIANYGKVLVQSQHDSTQIDSAKDVKISAKGRVIIMAEDIVLVNSAGAYLSLKGGAPEIGGPGPMHVKTAGHHWDGAASQSAELPTFGEGSFSRTPRLLRASDGLPVQDMELKLERDGAAAVDGTTDAAGAAGETEADHVQQLVASFRAPPR